MTNFLIKSPRFLLVGLCTWVLLGGLVACGFQLRGSQSLPFQSISIESVQQGSVLKQLTAELKLRNILITEAAGIRLLLGRDTFQRKAIQLSRSGTINEYELTHQIDLNIVRIKGADTGKNQSLWSEPEVIRTVRRFDDDQTKLLAKKEEEVLIRKEMVNDIVRQIFLRLEALKGR